MNTIDVTEQDVIGYMLEAILASGKRITGIVISFDEHVNGTGYEIKDSDDNISYVSPNSKKTFYIP